MKKFSQTLKILSLLCLILSGQVHTTQLPKLTQKQHEEVNHAFGTIEKQAEAFKAEIRDVSLSQSALIALMLKWFEQGKTLGKLDIETFAENSKQHPEKLVKLEIAAEEFSNLVNNYVNSENSKEALDELHAQYKVLQRLNNSPDLNRLFIGGLTSKSSSFEQFSQKRKLVDATARRMRFSQVQAKNTVDYQQLYVKINGIVLEIVSWGIIATSFFGALSFYNANFEEDPAVVKNLYIRGSSLFVSMGAMSIGAKVFAEIQGYLQKRWAKKDPEWKNMDDKQFADYVAKKIVKALEGGDDAPNDAANGAANDADLEMQQIKKENKNRRRRRRL